MDAIRRMTVRCVAVAMLLGASVPAVAADHASSNAEAYRLTRAHTGELLKLRGEFGLYVGRARSVTPEGLSGFEDDPAWRTGLPKPPEPLGWDEIRSVERRGNESLKCALIGGAVLTIPGAFFGALGASEGGSGSALEGAVTWGGAGVVLGAIVGAAFPTWHRVFSR